ncbi:MAG: haloacid dehalogenase-like hydrolase [Bacteroidales bacterium]|nr:haloacid dehalogenase-like hydrolase [Bacteroidales bacterium]
MVRLFLLPLMALGLACASCSQSAPLLEQGNWNPRVHEALCVLLNDYGSSSDAYNPDCKPYAVFDFDNTTAINDIANTLLCWQIDNLVFKIRPEDWFATLTAGLPDLDADYGSGNTPRSLAADIAADYAALHGYGDLSDMHASEAWLDFRAKLWYFYVNSDISAPDSPLQCEWITRLQAGMTAAEITDFTRRAADEAMQEKVMWEEEWRSPDGKVFVNVVKGLAISPEIKNLYAALRRCGFDVYICSASLETVVEALACEPRYGLDMDPEHVWGFHMSSDSEGRLVPVAEEGYVQPYRGGKVECIRRFIAQVHGGNGPALVAGDSNGDFKMLTSFPDLKLGLIVDCLNDGDIGALTAEARRDSSEVCLKDRTTPLYVVQGRKPSALSFIPADASEEVPLRP